MSFALLFPGQGAQSIGMLADYTQRHAVFRATFEQASQVLSQDLLRLISEGPEEELNLTVNTQPMMLTASVAVWRVWSELSAPRPRFMGGHSLGEYSALTCAGVFEFEDAVRVVRKRAQLMQAAVPAPHGAMAVILGLEAKRVIALCAEASHQRQVVEAVNFNTATQTVIAGHCGAVDTALKIAKDRGAKRCVPLPISVPAHSSLLKGAADEFGEFLSCVPLHTPSVPVVHNTSVEISQTADEIREALTLQLHTPVRWVETIDYFKEAGVKSYVEVGPGRVLAGLNRGIDKSLDTLSTDTPERLEKALAALEA